MISLNTTTLIDYRPLAQWFKFTKINLYPKIIFRCSANRLPKMNFNRTALILTINCLMFTYGSIVQAITDPITITFENMGLSAAQGGGAAFYGKTNITSGCTISQRCYKENGMLVGTIYDPLFGGDSAHIHRADGVDIKLNHHADAAGIYITTENLTAFSLDSFHLDASDNSGQWEILGFSEAYNPDLHSWQWPGDQQPKDIDNNPRVYTGSGPYPNQVAYQTVSSGFNGTVTLMDDFKNIKAFWIHFKGYPNAPIDTASWNIFLNNVQLSAPQMHCLP